VKDYKSVMGHNTLIFILLRILPHVSPWSAYISGEGIQCFWNIALLGEV
jgi:hypothetical protein